VRVPSRTPDLDFRHSNHTLNEIWASLVTCLHRIRTVGPFERICGMGWAGGMGRRSVRADGCAHTWRGSSRAGPTRPQAQARAGRVLADMMDGWGGAGRREEDGHGTGGKIGRGGAGVGGGGGGQLVRVSPVLTAQQPRVLASLAQPFLPLAPPPFPPPPPFHPSRAADELLQLVGRSGRWGGNVPWSGGWGGVDGAKGGQDLAAGRRGTGEGRMCM
jgi:hypothetical protein